MKPRARMTAAVAAAGVAVMLAGSMLPNGLPLGVVLLGVVLGSLSGLTAMGLVLVYRSSRIINFAQAEIGGLAAAVAIVMVAGYRLPYLLAVPLGLGAAVATGALIDITVVRRFFRAPRLILTVATIGLAQILGALELGIPSLVTHLRPLTTFTTPWHVRRQIGPIVFNGDHLVAVAAVLVALGGLAWFLGRTDTGIAIRASADSTDRALLLGIPVARLSRITWMVAAGLSGVGAILSAPVVGPNLGVVAGPVALLVPLVGAVIAGMESLPGTLAASIGIGVFEQAVFWSYPRSSTVDAVLFVVVLAALLLRRRLVSRGPLAEVGAYVPEVRPVPAALAKLPEVRWVRLAGAVGLALVIVVLPSSLSRAHQTLAAYTAIYGIIAVSLVVLTGWSGQISLGQFAFVGVGAATTATLVVHGRDLFVALVMSALVGAVVAIVIGLPAVRVPGLFLAATTLVFGVPVSTYLLNSSYFPSLNPSRFDRPVLLGRIDLGAPLTFYYFCLAGLVITYVLARNFRRSRVGRAALGVRDNPLAAAAYGIDPVRTKLIAFAFSGALAGLAGGLYAIGLRGIPYAGFSPEQSLIVFTMVVIGGLGSLPGALLGALYVEGARYFLSGGAQLLATGGGLLGLLLVTVGGLGQVLYAGRDGFLRRIARRHHVEVPTLIGQTDPAVPVEPAMRHPDVDAGYLMVEGVDASYGAVRVLFEVDFGVRRGEVVALLGTNGAGKSTVLRVVAGLLPAERGRVVFEDRDLSALGPADRVRAGVVTVPGGRGVFPSLTVAENLRLGAWLARRDVAFVSETTGEILAMFPNLAARLQTRASELSGGEQQMLTLGQAILCRPKVLLIDELSLGLAPVVVASLLDVVRRINAAGVTVVVVEQSVNVAAALAGRALFLERGQVRFAGDTTELTARPDLVRSVFLGNGSRRAARGRPARVPTSGADEQPRLEVRGIVRRFGGVTAVDDVSLAVRGGGVLGLIGANGSGKTTLFDVCSGYLDPDAGEVLLDGHKVTRRSPAERAERGLGRAFQDARLFPALTVTETLAVALDRHAEVRDPFASIMRLGAVVDSEVAVDRRVAELIDRMGLVRYRDAFISELSTGTRRVVELACALAHWPRVLLLDEPSTGLAQAECEVLGQLLLDVRDWTGAAVVVVEHDIPLISSIADELICLHLGEVIAQGAPADVLRADAVVASYLGEELDAIARSGQRTRPGPRARTRTRAAAAKRQARPPPGSPAPE